MRVKYESEITLIFSARRRSSVYMWTAPSLVGSGIIGYRVTGSLLQNVSFIDHNLCGIIDPEYLTLQYMNIPT